MKLLIRWFVICLVAVAGTARAQNRPPVSPTTEKKADEKPHGDEKPQQ